MPGTRSHERRADTDTLPTATSAFASFGSGKSYSMLTAFTSLPPERQRFALLLVQAMEDVAADTELPEADVRSMVYRLLQAAVLQERRAPAARRELARVLGPALGDLDPVPYATVEQARRLAALRASLLRDGAWSTAAIADARGITTNNARQWVSRHRKAHRIFTVTHEGETLVPALLLDEELEPRPAVQEPIRLLHDAGEDGWALWAWFATPSAWVGGRIPSELLASEPDLVARARDSGRPRWHDRTGLPGSGFLPGPGSQGPRSSSLAARSAPGGRGLPHGIPTCPLASSVQSVRHWERSFLTARRWRRDGADSVWRRNADGCDARVVLSRGSRGGNQNHLRTAGPRAPRPCGTERASISPATRSHGPLTGPNRHDSSATCRDDAGALRLHAGVGRGPPRATDRRCHAGRLGVAVTDRRAGPSRLAASRRPAERCQRGVRPIRRSSPVGPDCVEPGRPSLRRSHDWRRPAARRADSGTARRGHCADLTIALERRSETCRCHPVGTAPRQAHPV